MHTTDVPLAPEARLREIAALLAAGFLRLKRRTGCVPGGDFPPHVPAEDSSGISPELAGCTPEGAAP